MHQVTSKRIVSGTRAMKHNVYMYSIHVCMLDEEKMCFIIETRSVLISILVLTTCIDALF